VFFICNVPLANYVMCEHQGDTSTSVNSRPVAQRMLKQTEMKILKPKEARKRLEGWRNVRDHIKNSFFDTILRVSGFNPRDH
jgi:hypothetical protein